MASKHVLTGETTAYNAKFIVASDDAYCVPRYFLEKDVAVRCAKQWKHNCPRMAIYVEEKGGARNYLA